MKEQRKEEIKIGIGCNEDEVKYITKRIIEFNDNKIKNKKEVEKINLFLRDNEGKVCGGILSIKFLNCLRIHLYWIDEEYRSLGYGKKLLSEVDKIAKEKGCDLIYFNTYSFKNPEFYKKHDYRLIGIEDNYDRKYKRYYFKKKI